MWSNLVRGTGRKNDWPLLVAIVQNAGLDIEERPMTKKQQRRKNRERRMVKSLLDFGSPSKRVLKRVKSR